MRLNERQRQAAAGRQAEAGPDENGEKAIERAAERLERAIEKLTGEVLLGSEPRPGGGNKAVRTVDVTDDGVSVRVQRAKLADALNVLASGVERFVELADAYTRLKSDERDPSKG